MLFVISGLIAWFMLHYVQIMDIPNDRSSHEKPIPRSGGVAIVITFSIGSILVYFFSDGVDIPDSQFWTFLGCALIIAGVSCWDDLTQKSFHEKLFTQIFCVLIILGFGLLINHLYLPFFGKSDLGVFSYLITAVWIFGLTNAVNFMDGLDGLVGGVTFVATAFLCVIALLQDSQLVYQLSVSLFAGIAGFLIFNWSPARIFMGDVGSAFLGFVFSLIAIIGQQGDGHLPFYVIPLLLLNLIFDTAFTVFRRLLGGENVLQPHRSHIYQLLNRLGWSHARVSKAYIAATVIQGVGALCLVGVSEENRLWVFIPFLAAYSSIALVVIRRSRIKGILQNFT